MAIHLIQSFLDPYQEFRMMEQRRLLMNNQSVQTQSPDISYSMPGNNIREIDKNGNIIQDSAPNSKVDLNSSTDNIQSRAGKKTPVDLQNVSQSMRKDKTQFSDKNVNTISLDMEQAISDMKKDGILSQYQFFVGTSKNTSREGTVLSKDGTSFLPVDGQNEVKS